MEYTLSAHTRPTPCPSFSASRTASTCPSMSSSVRVSATVAPIEPRLCQEHPAQRVHVGGARRARVRERQHCRPLLLRRGRRYRPGLACRRPGVARVAAGVVRVPCRLAPGVEFGAAHRAVWQVLRSDKLPKPTEVANDATIPE